MPRKKQTEEPFDEMPGRAHEAPPDIPSPKRGPQLRVVKEFDLKTAHLTWKERNGIDDDW